MELSSFAEMMKRRRKRMMMMTTLMTRTLNETARDEAEDAEGDHRYALPVVSPFHHIQLCLTLPCANISFFHKIFNLTFLSFLIKLKRSQLRCCGWSL